MLFTPFIGQAYGILMGLDRMPGWMTLGGTLVSLFGLYFVGVGSREKARITKKL